MVMESGHQELELLRQEWLAAHCDSPRDVRHPQFCPLPAWLEAAQLGQQPIRADVLDRSDHGFCLALSGPCPLQPGDRLKLAIEEAGQRTVSQVRVCWREETPLIVAVGVAYDES